MLLLRRFWMSFGISGRHELSAARVPIARRTFIFWHFILPCSRVAADRGWAHADRVATEYSNREVADAEPAA